MATINLEKIKQAVEREDGLLPKIKIVGVGGAGVNAVNRMVTSGMHGVEFIVTHCLAQALILSKAENRIQLGENVTKGLTAGANPEIGQKAAEEARDALIENLRGADIVCIVAGMGGGTGTGASPILATCAKEAGAMTIAVVVKPFLFEGQRRKAQAEAGIVKLKEHVDMLVTIANESLLAVMDRNTSMTDAFRYSDETVFRAVRAMLEIVAVSGPALCKLIVKSDKDGKMQTMRKRYKICQNKKGKMAAGRTGNGCNYAC